MSMRTPEELSNLIKELIEEYTPEVKMVDFGIVFQVGDGIARIYGLDRVMSGELLEFEDGTLGIALNLEANNVGAVLLGDGLKITEGSRVRCTGKIAEIPVGEAYLGRVVDALARPVDGKGAIATSENRAIESPAPGIVARRSVYEPLQTGLVAVDAMIPIGRGQRELIIGDRQTGKTAIAVDTILNQKGKGVICVYVAIGQKASSVASAIRTLEEKKVSKVGEDIIGEYIGIINYCVIAMMQLELPDDAPQELNPADVAVNFDQKILETKELMFAKNHDYGEVWRDMRVSSLTDLILMKILRVKQIEDNKGKTLASEGVFANYQDMINYSIFALIKLGVS